MHENDEDDKELEIINQLTQQVLDLVRVNLVNEKKTHSKIEHQKLGVIAIKIFTNCLINLLCNLPISLEDKLLTLKDCYSHSAHTLRNHYEEKEETNLN